MVADAGIRGDRSPHDGSHEAGLARCPGRRPVRGDRARRRRDAALV